jgi:hypothetical protein
MNVPDTLAGLKANEDYWLAVTEVKFKEYIVAEQKWSDARQVRLKKIVALGSSAQPKEE